MNTRIENQKAEQATEKWAININGKDWMTGDEASIGAIFNNLSGTNFKNPEPWREGTYEQYMDYMRVEYEQTFAQGESITLIDPQGVETDSHTF